MPKTNLSSDLSDYSRSRRSELLRRLKNGGPIIQNRNVEVGSKKPRYSSTEAELLVLPKQLEQNCKFRQNTNHEVVGNTALDENTSMNHEEVVEDVVTAQQNEDEELQGGNGQRHGQDDDDGNDSNENDDDSNEDDDDETREENGSQNEEYDESETSQEESEVENETSDEEEINVDEDANTPLYAGASITSSESMISILTYVMAHNLTGSAFADLLQLISIHLPSDSMHKRTIYRFMKFFINNTVPLKKHYYCASCMRGLRSKRSTCNCKNHENDNNGGEISYFIEIPAANQLQELLLQPGFVDDLSYRRNRIKENDASIEDIFDGKLYQEHMDNNNPDNDKFNLSFMWYTDGAPVFKSRSYSVWPFYLVINELPYEKRIMKENMIVAGLWFGPSEPMVNLFLTPIYQQMAEFNVGIPMKIPNLVNLKIVKAWILCGTCDTPARGKFLNHKRFNGEYGCPRCKSQGATVSEEGVFFRTHVYPFEENLQLKTKEDYDNLELLAYQTGEPQYGIKGPCILNRMMPDIVRGTAIDVMHCVYLGVVKLLAKLWIESEFRYRPWSLYDHREIIDQRLMKIKPPGFIKRMPRSLTKHSNYWKASEWKNFFLFYSLPIVNDLMEEKYLKHYIKLVCAIYILNGKSISVESINDSRNLLTEFVSDFESLYDKRFLTFNIHSLQHLPDVVQDLGPLWVTSCFPFEDLLGKMKNCVHGTRYVGIQIYTKLISRLILTGKINNLRQDSQVAKFCKKLKTIGKRINSLRPVNRNMYALGKIIYLNNIPQELQVALNNARSIVNRPPLNIRTFFRLKKGKQTIHSLCYRRRTSFASYCVQFTTTDGIKVGFVQFFIKACNCPIKQCDFDCNGSRFYVFLKEIEVGNPFKTKFEEKIMNSVTNEVNHIEKEIILSYLYRQIEENSPNILVNVNAIVGLCYLIRIGEKVYIEKPNNNIEYSE